MVSIKDFVDRDAKILEICRGKRVLHLGCLGFPELPVQEKLDLVAAGFHSKMAKCCDCVGVDIDADTIRLLHDRKVFDDAHLLIGDVEELGALSLKPQSFEMVVAGDIIEHLSNPGKMLAGARKLLGPGGVLVVSTPNAFGLPNYLRFIAGRYREGAQHVLSFSQMTLEQLLARNGFAVREAYTGFESHAKTAHGVWFGPAKSFLSSFPRFGGTLLFVCQSAT